MGFWGYVAIGAMIAAHGAVLVVVALRLGVRILRRLDVGNQLTDRTNLELTVVARAVKDSDQDATARQLAPDRDARRPPIRIPTSITPPPKG